MAKYRRTAAIEVYEGLRDAAGAIESLEEALRGLPAGTPDEQRSAVMNLEGRAGAVYWAAVALLVPPDLRFPGREHRGAADPLNGALNYGYGVLQSQAWVALTMAGLDPFGGFLHVDRPGRPSMVLDLMEEFRAPVVDRAVMAMVGLGQRPVMAEGLLDRSSRRLVAQRVLERLASRERYGRRQFGLRTILTLQARAVAMHVRGVRPYRAFVARW
jgi:CRISP-associated protein Cas1